MAQQGASLKHLESRKVGSALDERNAGIWSDYVAGMTVEQLALKYDLSQPGTYLVLKRLRQKYGKLNHTDADVMRERLIAQALDIMVNLSELLHADPIPAYSNGKPILDKDGNVAQDHSGRLNAARVLLLANKRLAELTGTDAAQQIDITVTQQAQQQADSAAQEALARVFATVTDVPAIEATRADLVVEAETVLAEENAL
jgi:hypothetical protein